MSRQHCLCPGWESSAHSRKEKRWQQSLPRRLVQAKRDRVAGDGFPRSGMDTTSPVEGQAADLGVTDFL